ncbi:unnamed protein product [Vitrella brassicaformis CCMP3155]|uniref:Galactosylgalactosylxylosylprotein 3-beta-glucuronosyltransferase n=2 Tax=Vitrella brassicaformis TaxID=1169539 RepID=A0A0G4GTF3_VITBC|nr:unnamed protein product [Vitrella brassicaformis CCMP3155]|eukprot:CEM34023.1 unnamed protein product [Vitrella brassicaformis CCMP3155]
MLAADEVAADPSEQPQDSSSSRDHEQLLQHSSAPPICLSDLPPRVLAFIFCSGLLVVVSLLSGAISWLFPSFAHWPSRRQVCEIRRQAKAMQGQLQRLKDNMELTKNSLTLHHAIMMEKETDRLVGEMALSGQREGEGGGGGRDAHDGHGLPDGYLTALPLSEVIGNGTRVVFVICPTHERPTQVPDLIRLFASLATVRINHPGGVHIHLILVEDASTPSQTIQHHLDTTSMNRQMFSYDHLILASTPGLRVRGAEPRNRGIWRLREIIRAERMPHLRDQLIQSSVVYFADDDNAYHPCLFSGLHSVPSLGVGLLGVGWAGEHVVERYLVDDERSVNESDGHRAAADAHGQQQQCEQQQWAPHTPTIREFDAWEGGRDFQVDVAGLVFGVGWFLTDPPLLWSPFSQKHFNENDILKATHLRLSQLIPLGLPPSPTGTADTHTGCDNGCSQCQQPQKGGQPPTTDSCVGETRHKEKRGRRRAVRSSESCGRDKTCTKSLGPTKPYVWHVSSMVARQKGQYGRRRAAMAGTRYTRQRRQ